jgi:AcrR family transcriptional regulator
MKSDLQPVDKPSGAGRPRDPRIDAAVLSAAAELLPEVGYANLTMAAIAERAGTTKTALYRRWSSKAELVHEAAFPTTPSALSTPEGDIVGDIRAMIAAARDVFTSPAVRAALPGLMADMSADEELNARVVARFHGLFDVVRVRLEHGIERGEVQADVKPERLIEIIGGATMLRMLLHPESELDEQWVDETATIVTHGVISGA